MSNETQGTIHAASEGGVAGTHPKPDPLQLLVAPSTSSELNTARLRLIPVACWRVDDIRFAFDSSFVTPDIKTELQMLAALRQEHGRPAPGGSRVEYPALSVFGHADPVGPDDYNKALSGRRATTIYALLIANSDLAKAMHLWHDVAAAENWSAAQRQIMQETTGLAQGTPDAALFKAYIQALCPEELVLTRQDFLARGADPQLRGDIQGCSSFNPLLIFSQKKQDEYQAAEANNDEAGIAERDAANAQNRRVMVLLFRRGSKVDPARWPCPQATAGARQCIHRFFSDGEKRRKTRLPDQPHKYADTRDTFACRFYDRITSGSPCYPSDRVPLIIRFLDCADKPIADASYVLRVGEERFEGVTDNNGKLSHLIPLGEATGTVDLGFYVFDLVITDLLPVNIPRGLQARLNNLGLFDDAPLDDEQSEPMQLAMMRFQQRQMMDTTGQSDDASAGKLKGVHDGYRQIT
jgi:hypothetical protein